MPTEALGIAGGARTAVKKHHTKEAAKQALNKELKKKIAASILDEEHPEQPPPMIQDIVVKIRRQVDEYRRKYDAGELIIPPAIEKLDDDKLMSMVEELEQKRSGVTQDARVQQLAHMIIPEIAIIDGSTAWLRKVKTEILEVFTDILVKEYMAENLTFNLAKLVLNVNSVIAYRRGVRRAVEENSESPESPEEPPAAETTCVVT